MAIPDRNSSEHPSRDELFRQMIETLARGRVAAERREEAKAKALADVNRPAASQRGFDEFRLAAERMAAREAFVEAVLAQCDVELAAIERAAQLRRKHARIMARAREALGPERYDRLMKEKAARRRAKR